MMNAKAPTSKKMKILIIDDDMDQIEILALRLNQAGYEVISAVTGEEGIEKVTHEHPNLILLDLILPPDNGFTVFNRLRMNPITARIPTVIITACDNPNFRKEAQQYGIQHFLQKPVSSENLIKLVQKVAH